MQEPPSTCREFLHDKVLADTGMRRSGCDRFASPSAYVTMHPLLRPLASLLMLALHAGSWAGPVPATEADGGNIVGASPAAAAPSISMDVPGEGLAPTAASSPSSSALAAELIKESGAGANAVEAPQPPRRESARTTRAPAASSATPDTTARGRPGTADNGWTELRELGKAAIHWVKETIPWLRSDADEHDRQATVLQGAADWSASPLDRDARRAPNQSPDAAAIVAAEAAVREGQGNPTRPHAFDPEQNLIRAAINSLRELLEHPMTWLVALLIAIGAIVVKKIDRRPMK